MSKVCTTPSHIGAPRALVGTHAIDLSQQVNRVYISRFSMSQSSSNLIRSSACTIYRLSSILHSVSPIIYRSSSNSYHASPLICRRLFTIYRLASIAHHPSPITYHPAFVISLHHHHPSAFSPQASGLRPQLQASGLRL